MVRMLLDSVKRLSRLTVSLTLALNVTSPKMHVIS